MDVSEIIKEGPHFQSGALRRLSKPCGRNVSVIMSLKSYLRIWSRLNPSTAADEINLYTYSNPVLCDI